MLYPKLFITDDVIINSDHHRILYISRVRKARRYVDMI